MIPALTLVLQPQPYNFHLKLYLPHIILSYFICSVIKQDSLSALASSFWSCWVCWLYDLHFL